MVPSWISSVGEEEKFEADFTGGQFVSETGKGEFFYYYFFFPAGTQEL